MTLTYFAADGSYGDAAGLEVIDTSHWDENDWDTISFARDDERLEIARQLATGNPDQLSLFDAVEN
jgi:hypothetical protein